MTRAVGVCVTTYNQHETHVTDELMLTFIRRLLSKNVTLQPHNSDEFTLPVPRAIYDRWETMTDMQRGIYCALHGYKWITHEDELKEKLADNRKRQDALEVAFAKLIAEATELEQEINRERERNQREIRNTGGDNDWLQ